MHVLYGPVLHASLILYGVKVKTQRRKGENNWADMVSRPTILLVRKGWREKHKPRKRALPPSPSVPTPPHIVTRVCLLSQLHSKYNMAFMHYGHHLFGVKWLEEGLRSRFVNFCRYLPPWLLITTMRLMRYESPCIYMIPSPTLPCFKVPGH